MAGFATPVLATLGTIQAVRSTVNSVRSLTGGSGEDDDRAAARASLTDARQAADREALRADQELDTARRRANARDEADRLAVTAAGRERQRLASLRRAVARQRAQLGSQGISAADGSGEAILLGLIDESDADRADNDRLDRLRLAALDRDEETAARRDLLSLTRQQERQRLDRLAQGRG
jgi:hypothetical protein